MRVSRGFVASVAGLTGGLVAALLAVVWLRAAVSDAGLLWNAVTPGRLATWLLAAAHGVPLVVRSAAGLTAEEAGGSLGRIGELLGGDDVSAEVAFSFSVVLVPLTLLAIVGGIVALVARTARPQTPRQLAALSAAAGTVYGAGLFAAARLAQLERVFEGGIAPELGLEGATGHLAIGVGPAPGVAVVVGVIWGAAFAAAGGMSRPEMRAYLDPRVRMLLRGWARGLGAGAGVIAVGLAGGALGALITGRAPGVALTGLGAYLLSTNAVAAGLVLTHGASMSVALDAGPFTGWERVDFLNIGASATPVPWVVWLAAVVPIVAGVVAGRFVRGHTDAPVAWIGFGFGGLWGLTLATLALLLRVRVLSSFSVGELALGGGSAVIDPLVTMGLGLLWGTATAGAGAFSTRWRRPVG